MRKEIDITGGKPSKVLLQLAAPVILLYIMRGMFNIVDMFWLGKLGPDYIAGVSGSIFMVWAIHGLSSLVTVGIVAIVARNVGEKDRSMASVNSTYSIIYAAAGGLVVTIVLFPLIEIIISLIGLEPVAYTSGVDYLDVMVTASSLMFVLYSLHALIVAWGDTKTPLIIYSFAFMLNIVLTPVCVFGFGPVPRMETAGAALATVISHVVAATIFFIVLIRRGWLSKRNEKKPVSFITYLKVGYPIALTGMFFSFIYFFIANIAARFGSIPVAAMGVGHKIESVAYFFSIGFASALSTYTGQNLGAGKPERVWEGAMFSIKFVSIVVTAYSLLVYILAPSIVSIFNADPAFIAEGVLYLRIVLVAEGVQSILIVIENGVFSGAGFTRPSFSVSFPTTIARIPIAYILAVVFNLQSTGIWLTILITMFINSIVFMVIFSKKQWLEHKIS